MVIRLLLPFFVNPRHYEQKSAHSQGRILIFDNYFVMIGSLTLFKELGQGSISHHSSLNPNSPIKTLTVETAYTQWHKVPMNR